MKTTLVVLDWQGRFIRAAMPGDCAPDYLATLKHVPARTITASRGFGPERRERDPEHVRVSVNGFKPKQGKLERIRRLPDAAVAALERIDQERVKLKQQLEEIQQREDAILAEFYPQSRQIKMTEVRGFKDLNTKKEA